MPLESPGHAGAQTSMQSTILLHNRIRVRSQGSAGTSRGFGKASSRYSQINVDSMIAFPSCTSVGTMPLGLSFKYFGSYCSACALIVRRFTQADLSCRLATVTVAELPLVALALEESLP